jgi:hypothetical protein
MSRKVLIPLAIALLAVLVMTWHSAALPATVVIINASGSPIANVAVAAANSRFEIGSMNNGETRRVKVPSGSIVSLSFHGLGDKQWETGEPLTAGRTIVLYVTAGDHVDARDRIGGFAR